MELLHASAVELYGKSILIKGEAGSGKSSLAIKMIAMSSICPGKTNANPRLKPVIANTNNSKVIAIRRKPPKLGHP